MNLTQSLNTIANQRPDTTALSCEGQTLTFKSLWLSAQQVAQTLQHNGVNNIAVIAQDHFESLMVLYGAAKAGATITFINPNLTTPEINYIIEDCGATQLFVSPAIADANSGEFAPLTTLPLVLLSSHSKVETHQTENSDSRVSVSFKNWCIEREEQQPNLSPDLLNNALLKDANLAQQDNSSCTLQLYTSGTTGRPKGVQLPDDNLFAVVNNMREAGENWYLWQPDDIGISALPFFHIGGLWWATTAIAAGAQLEIMPRFIPAKYLNIVATEKVTRLALVPAMLMMVMAEPDAKSTDFSSVRNCVYGGSPMPVSLLKRAKKRIACDFIQIYGLTETGNTAICLWPEDHNNSALLKAAGRPYPGVEVKCIDEAGNQVETNQHGEICLKSPANMTGYRNLPQATADTLKNGWVHTGDVGYINDDGYLFVCDRIKDMIISAGENIYPAEIEVQFEDFSPVAEAVAIGIPDEQTGEHVKLLIRLSSDTPCSEQDILAFLRPRIAAHKIPKSIEFVANFPRTASGKVQRAKLRSTYWEGRSRNI